MIVKIDKLDHQGRGITRINDKVTFVENALPNELVDIRITKEKKNYNEGEVVKLIEKSKQRKEAICPYYNKCGGCEIMHMEYDAQIEYKKEKVQNILKKYANIEITPEVFISDKDFNYRNKITLHKENNKLGYMKKKTNEIVEIDACPLALESINEYLKTLKEVKTDNLVIRTNEKGKIISTLIDKLLLIKINEYTFQVDIKSFFQVNNNICGKIFKYIEDNLKEYNICLDLYSGVGTLSIVASKKVSLVYSIEINENSHKNAIKNLELNNIKNVKLILGSVEEKIKEIKEKVDVIITDPPRSGMDEITINVIEKLKPKQIIYVSCNPLTLARDLNKLKENYKLEKSAIFDMFPNTSHIECICILNMQ